MLCGQFECNTSNVQTANAQYFNSTNSTPCIDTNDNGEGVILVGDQQDGGKKCQISTPISAFSAIVGVSLKRVL